VGLWGFQHMAACTWGCTAEVCWGWPVLPVVCVWGGGRCGGGGGEGALCVCVGGGGRSRRRT